MATYAIGDIQGCDRALQALLALIDFDPDRDHILLVGDLVNRGPDSLAVLRTVYEHRHAFSLVLGNHDLYLLMLECGAITAKTEDTLGDVLAAPDSARLCAWLRQQPLCRKLTVASREYVMVHAGLIPSWHTADALRYSAEVETAMQADDHADFFSQLWGGSPTRWHTGLVGIDRLRLITNIMTRMRFCSAQDDLDLVTKGVDAPPGFAPWFAHAHRLSRGQTLITGHWSALGLHLERDLLALDSAYLWGGRLSAYRLDDGMLFQISCPPDEALHIDD